MAWVDGKEHKLPWSFRKPPMAVIQKLMGAINDRPFLGVEQGRLQLQRADYTPQPYGGWTVVFTFMECPADDSVILCVDDQGTQYPFMEYDRTDFRRMFIEPRVGLWRRIVNWFKGGAK